MTKKTLQTLAFLGLVFVTISAPGLARSQPAPAQSPKGIAASLQPFVDSHTLAGAVTLVASKDKILSLEAVGYADVAAKRAMRADNLFWIASMSKPITAAALMMLVDEGKVHVDDPVEKYLPEFQGQMVAIEQDQDHVLLKRPAHPITVKNILSHTSGLPFMSRVEHKIDQFPLGEAVVTYALTPLKFEPGTKYDYSNAGINTAGRIIEVVSGMRYEDFLDSRLFQPLGMKDTTFWPNDEQVQRLAKSYRPNADNTGLEETLVGQCSYPLSDRRRGPSPAGGLFSTATDVSLFCRMILNGGTYQGKRYLSPAAVQQMTSTQTDHGNYGFGWSTTRKAHGEPEAANLSPCGHGGAYSTNMWIDPQHQLVTVFMVQHAGYPGKDGGKIQPAFTKAAMDLFAK
jgi:CubicO group peptidase (beta-lactamase class C family)